MACEYRLPDNAVHDADLVGWDPASGIAVLRTQAPLNLAPPAIAEKEARPGEIVLALARSWSNSVTASYGTVAVVGGPLRTGRRSQLARVIRVNAPMHDGFAGGGVFNASGQLIGIATASAIRGFGVVIPGSIAWASGTQVLSSGTPRRGFIGVAVQSVELAASQRADGRERALLVLNVTPGSPAETAGVLVGDLLLEFDGKATVSSEDLLDALSARQAGQTVTARTRRGGTARDVPIAIAERKAD